MLHKIDNKPADAYTMKIFQLHSRYFNFLMLSYAYDAYGNQKKLRKNFFSVTIPSSSNPKATAAEQQIEISNKISN